MKPPCETNTQMEKYAEYETGYVQGSKLPIGDKLIPPLMGI